MRVNKLATLSYMSAAIVVALLGSGMASTATVDAAPVSQQASLTASPGEGTPGATLTVSGSGFPSGADVTFTWDGSSADMPTKKVGGNGRLRSAVTVPSRPPGSYVLEAIAGSVRASTTVKVLALATVTGTPTTSPSPTATQATATPTPTSSSATATPIQSVTPTVTSTSGAQRTLYVSPGGSDSNPGTQSQPWRTFYHAADTARAGDLVIFEDGVYVETTTRPYTSFRNSGTATAPIVFRARNKHKATIYFRGLADKQKLMIMGNKYVTIQDFEITQDTMGTNYNDVLIRCWADSNGNGADYCRIAGNYIHNAVEPVKTSGSTGATFEGNTITGARVAFGSFNGDRVIFRDNEILNASTDGIQTKGGTRSARIYNNYIHTTGTNAMSGAAIYIGGGSCETCGLYDVNGYEGYGHAVYNNVIVAATPGKIRWGLLMQGCDECGAYNNVVRGTVTALQTMKSGPWAGRYVPTDNPRFLNNIIDGCTTGAYFEPSYTTGTITADYNLFYGCSSGVPSQAHPVTGAPQFVDPLSDWHLRSTSPAIGHGTAVTHTGYYGEQIDVSLRRDGSRRTVPWSLGVY